MKPFVEKEAQPAAGDASEPRSGSGCEARDGALARKTEQSGSSFPRSGVAGYEPEQVRDALVANDWSVIPIVQHDAHHRSAGKAPAIPGWQRFAQFGGPLPSADELAEWAKIKNAPGTGLGCGSIIAIDIDFSHDPEMVERIKKAAFTIFGETPFMRIGRAPKVLLLYRAKEPIVKRAFKVADGSGDGLDIQGIGSQVVAYGIHPGTGEPYRWVGAAQPHNARPSAAPEIAAAQLEEFLDLVRGFCDFGSSAVAERRGAGGHSNIVKDRSGRVVDGRESHLRDIAFDVLRRTSEEDVDLSRCRDAIIDEVWHRFRESANLEDNRWQRSDAAAKVDVLIAKMENRTLSFAPAADSAKGRKILAEMNERYCVVQESGKSYVLSFERERERETPVYQSFSSFREFHMHRKIRVGEKSIGIGNYWLNHPERRQYDGVTFIPNGDRVVDNRLNLWRGWGVTPKRGSWALMQAHILEVLARGEQDNADYILKWAAWAVQHPGEVPEVALVFKGAEGTGKGIFFRTILNMFGQHGLHISSSKHLAGTFNAHLRDVVLLFADEAFFPGDKEAEGTLKRVLTEESLFVEPKGMNGFRSPNFLHVGMATNASWAVPAGLDSRRFAVFDVSSERKQDHAYFAALNEELKAGGVEAMLYDLLAMPLGGWHPRNLVRTDALRDQQLATLGPEDAWWLSTLERGTIPGAFDGLPSVARMDDMIADLKGKDKRASFLTQHRFGRYLREQGVQSGKWRNDRRGWRFPPLREARAAWEKKLPGYEWEDPDQDEWREQVM